MTQTMLAGTALQDITPPAGELMAAFPDRQPVMKARIAEGAHDALHVRALALRQGESAAVLCAADVIGFQWPDVDRIRTAFSEQTGLPPEALILSGTHTHSGPETSYLFGGSPDTAYMDGLRERVVQAAAAACENLVPCKAISSASVEPYLNYNRRLLHPNGSFQQANRNLDRNRIDPVDPRVSVVRFDSAESGPVATLLHFAAHPVILTNPNRKFSAEYPGAALRKLEGIADCGAPLFFQGAAGDLHPFQAFAETCAAVEEMGRLVAEAGAEALEQVSPEDDLCLKLACWRGELPHRSSSEHRVRIEINAIELSPRLAFVFWQGEPFTELSLQLQWRSPFARTLVMGYSLGWIGYVPSRNAYEYGGYGVDLYQGDPQAFCRTMVPPGTGERLVDESTKLLNDLKEDQRPQTTPSDSSDRVTRPSDS